jgi:hypothetical protein
MIMAAFNMHSRLNILDVHRKINQKQEKKSICYEKVLDICQKRILALAERDKTCCLFEFPEYVPGYPLFDLNSCMEHCKKSLVASGFWVEYYFPNKFYISWNFEEIKGKKNEAKKQIPLSALSSLAMVPSDQNKQNTQNTQNTQNNFTNPMQTRSQTQSIGQIQMPPPPNIQPQTQYMHSIPSELQQKMTTPLPVAPPKYNPFDIHINTTQTTNANTQSSKSTNNTFFPKNPIEYKTEWNNQHTSDNKVIPTSPNNFKHMNDMMGLLTSSISTHNKSVFDYKPSGKLSLNV